MSTIFIIVIIVINALPSSLSSSRTRSLLPTGPWVNEILPLAVSCSLLTKHLGSSSLYFTTVQTTECRYVLNAFYHLSSRIILIMPPAEFLPPPSRIIRRPTDHWPEASRTLSRSPALYKKTKTTINTKTDTITLTEYRHPHTNGSSLDNHSISGLTLPKDSFRLNSNWPIKWF